VYLAIYVLERTVSVVLEIRFYMGLGMYKLREKDSMLLQSTLNSVDVYKQSLKALELCSSTKEMLACL